MEEKTERIAGIVRHSLVDGPGMRMAIFFQGCPHHCPGCHNPDTHDPSGGTGTTIGELAEAIRQTRYLDGVTFSGGEPFIHPEALLKLTRTAREKGLTVWSYSGWTFEELMANAAGEKAVEALKGIDVLVDGRFVEALRSEDHIYRGSSNQRLIDVQKSLAENRVVLWSPEDTV